MSLSSEEQLTLLEEQLTLLLLLEIVTSESAELQYDAKSLLSSSNSAKASEPQSNTTFALLSLPGELFGALCFVYRRGVAAQAQVTYAFG